MVSYFPPISSLNIKLIFVLLADNIKFVLGFIPDSFYSYVPSLSSVIILCKMPSFLS